MFKILSHSVRIIFNYLPVVCSFRAMNQVWIRVSRISILFVGVWRGYFTGLSNCVFRAIGLGSGSFEEGRNGSWRLWLLILFITGLLRRWIWAFQKHISRGCIFFWRSLLHFLLLFSLCFSLVAIRVTWRWRILNCTSLLSCSCVPHNNFLAWVWEVIIW